VILHVRYTAREAGDPLGSTAIKELKKAFADATRSPQALILNLKYDFPTEWAAFVNAAGNNPFTATIDSSFLPYYVQNMPKAAAVGSVRLFYDDPVKGLTQSSVPAKSAIPGLLSQAGGATFTLATDSNVMKLDPARQVYAVIAYTCG
jgi:hypothetical protein